MFTKEIILKMREFFVTHKKPHLSDFQNREIEGMFMTLWIAEELGILEHEQGDKLVGLLELLHKIENGKVFDPESIKKARDIEQKIKR